MPNRLAEESSPYLLQHANNPVDWYPWGDEAIARARDEQKPIFLSIGYSACHWCHVMEHESFENEAIADYINANFIAVKVDREERPDLDQIYMNAVQIMTGRGGWPMSVFLTPELQPFYGGTYWPPHARPDMRSPGFDQVLQAVLDAWTNRRDQAITQAAEMTNRIAAISDQFSESEGQLNNELLLAAAGKLEQNFDFKNGGFGGAPKFPHAMDLQFLMRLWHQQPREGVLHMVRLTLDKMANGGIYDHLGGGFARYTVDAKWLVPHFEKMLYDNGLLISAYLDLHAITQDDSYKDVVCDSLDYILRDMTDVDGAFHSTEDADSEGVEGKFYVWSPGEVTEVLGESASERFCYVYDVTEHGNFEGHSILNLPKTIQQCAEAKCWDVAELQAELAESRAKLLERRDTRVRPGKDDKIIVSWNGLMIDAMAQAANAFGRPDYRDAAVRVATFIKQRMTEEDGTRLLHTYRGGTAKLAGYLDDYACLANSLVSLYEATFDESWLEWGATLMETVLAHFPTKDGTLYYTADDHEQLITRTIDMHDSSVPSGNAIAATALVRLGRLCSRPDFLECANRIVQSAVPIIEVAPSAAGQMMIAADMLLRPAYEIVVCGGDDVETDADLLHSIHATYLPNCSVAYRAASSEGTNADVVGSLFDGRTSLNGELTTYICHKQTCEAPLTGAAPAVERIKQISQAETNE